MVQDIQMNYFIVGKNSLVFRYTYCEQIAHVFIKVVYDVQGKSNSTFRNGSGRNSATMLILSS